MLLTPISVLIFLFFCCCFCVVSPAGESASPAELAPCLLLLCMQEGGCTAQGPKLGHTGNYLNIKQQTFAKCTYETEGQLEVMDRHRVRQMSATQLEQAIAECQRNFSCASACIYNYYFTVWERCPRTDVRTGREFSECEKMAFAYHDQNGWCDEKEHIWEQVRRKLPSVQAKGGDKSSVEEEEQIPSSAAEEMPSDERPTAKSAGSPRGQPQQQQPQQQQPHVELEADEDGLADLFDSNFENRRPTGQKQPSGDSSSSRRQQRGGGSRLIGGMTQNRGGDGQVPGQFRLVDHLADLHALAQQLGLGQEVRRAENSFVFAEKDDTGRMLENGLRLVLTDEGHQLTVLKVGADRKPSRSALPKTDWNSMLNTLRGICIAMFQMN